MIKSPTREETLEAVKTSLAHRKTVVALQSQLECAWREAVTECPALNRKCAAENLPECAAKNQLLEAERKKRRVEALQQNTFLVFQTLTEEKNENQIALGTEILKPTRSDEEIAALAESFLHAENQINKVFLKKLNSTRKSVENLQKEAEEIKRMPCGNPKFEKGILRDLKLLIDLLAASDSLLSTK